MSRIIFKYGLILFASLSGFKFLEYQFFSHKLSLEFYLMIVATIFLLIGYAVSRYFYIKSIQTLQSSDTSNQTEIDLEALNKFSPREQEVLLLLSNGYTNKEIAKSLELSPNTVKTHLSKIYEKLDVSNRTEAVSEAKLLKLIK